MNAVTTEADFDYESVRRAYAGTSFTPEKRATDAIAARIQFLNGKLGEWQAVCQFPEQKAYLENAFIVYKTKYLQLFREQDARNSRHMSTMITGPANFPLRQQEKLNDSINNHWLKFEEWCEKAERAIRKRIAQLLPAEHKDELDRQNIKRHIMRTDMDNTLIKQNLAGRLQRWAANASPENIENVLAFLRAWQERNFPKTKFTDRHSVWKIHNTQPAVTAPITEKEINGVRIVYNTEIDRVQLFFDGKPDAATRTALKSSAWHYSPTQNAWQRKLTSNGCASAQYIVENYQKK